MKKSGFTIVELLIVVVVIAILASITVVSYRGVTDSAKNITLISALDVYEKALLQYQLKYGSYPSTLNGTGATVAVCLGEYGADGPFLVNQCLTSTHSGGEFMPPTVSSTTINNQLREFVSPLPTARYNTVVVSSGETGGPITNLVINARGITYISDLNNPNLATMSYLINGDQPCGRGEKTTEASSVSTTTRCTVKLQ